MTSSFWSVALAMAVALVKEEPPVPRPEVATANPFGANPISAQEID